MNRRDFLKAGAAASVVGVALPVKAEAEVTRPPLQDAPLKLHTNRMQRYQEYRNILNDNFELNNKIQEIADSAAQRVCKSVFGSKEDDDILTAYLGEWKYVEGRSTSHYHLYLRNLYRAYNLAVYGDGFYELVYNADYPDAHYGIPRRPILTQELPSTMMYRIETIKGKLVEYQQSKDGPDYAALSQPLEGTDPRLMLINKSTAIRFRPEEIYHLRIGPPIFQPYGTSLLEVVRKNPDAKIGEGAIENFFTVFEHGMKDLRNLCK